MAKIPPSVLSHLEWLSFVRPTGLVVSAMALVRAGAILDRRDNAGQQLLHSCVNENTFEAKEGPVPWIPDFFEFAEKVLGWGFKPSAFVRMDNHPVPPELCLPLPDLGITLHPDVAVRDLDPSVDSPPWQLLVLILPPGKDFDVAPSEQTRLELSPHSHIERLLRHTRVPAGLLFNGRSLRLVSAPRGENSGWLDFHVADMVQTAGRPICNALRLLLSQQRLLSLPQAQRLPALLADSRKYQNEVSERLAEQVLHALYELLRGFQSAHDRSNGELLHETLAHRPNDVYHALLTVILRLVFLLYAEERDLLPRDETFLRFYSLSGLYERLREDAALYPDTMDDRFGAWAQLVTLFRMIFDGAKARGMHLPARHGVLFDPDRFPFLEGRAAGDARQVHERIVPPLVPDGTVFRALEKLLVLDGERISYRALDVEQIGSVYETMMGFRLEPATGRSLAIRSHKKHGAPVTVDIEALLAESGPHRARWIQDRTDQKLTDKVRAAVASAATLEDLHAALRSLSDQAATPDLVPRGAMVLQPSDERRRSGSHYTPRALTEPIVRIALEPVLARLRGDDTRPPLPEAILDLKVCDPAMGSGAFLVETCRYLADALVSSWYAHDLLPRIPPDEDEVVHARRLVAQRCLYGVDRNPVAVDLAKMSLWLATLARDHALTFVDHALRHGDSLVGLSRRQIEAFHWDPDAPGFQEGFEVMRTREHLDTVSALRDRIREAGEDVTDREKRELWDEAQFELRKVRLLGDLVVAAYFGAQTTKERNGTRLAFVDALLRNEAEREWARIEERRNTEPPLAPFHWEIEFPEVFEREKPGFDACVGNPPFAGKNSVANGNVPGYQDWLKDLHAESHGNADLVAHFFRRVFNLIRPDGTFGLIATNTIAQGDTRASGLRWICTRGGEIYHVQKRVPWPGMAAVIVSIVHVMKGQYQGPKKLDAREVERITAFLFHRGGHEDPFPLAANSGKSFVGSYVLGMGFTFDDTDTKGIATPIAEMNRILLAHPECREVIFPYIGGEEVNDDPQHAFHRYVINFFDRGEQECWNRWPMLMSIIKEKVKPERDVQKRNALRERWWQYAEKRPGLVAAIAGLERVLVISRVSQHSAFAFLPVGTVFSEQLIVFSFETYASFCALQSRIHEIWSHFFASSLEDRLRYTPSDCFESFPFPENWETHPVLEANGREYYEFRAALMVRNNEGLTKTYNRFHDPYEVHPEIIHLRDLHSAMDHAVLDAYGWTDIKPTCDFLLDYEIDEEEWGNKKKPYRYRWPDEIRDEVLARLLDLNTRRAREERGVEGPPVSGHAKARATNKKSRKSDSADDRSHPMRFEP